jgi:hypothetical protein
MDIEVDTSWVRKDSVRLVGRMISDLHVEPHRAKQGRFRIEKHIDIDTGRFYQWAEESHDADLVLELRVCPRFDGPPLGKVDQQRVTVAQSEWLKLLESADLMRFDYVVLRAPYGVPVSKERAFAHAIEQLKQGEAAYLRGAWNQVGVHCRASWRTMLSTAPPGDARSASAYLLRNVEADAGRQELAKVIQRSVHDMLNVATHLEGDAKVNRPPTDMRPEDAAICLHWYSALIRYVMAVS